MGALHEKYMRLALALAERQLGQTFPNPAVGAVLMKDGQIIATGATAAGGRPHAETIAINNAGEKANGASLYVTLEPCSHQGKTPPCVNAIIEAGISKAIIACRDPNPKVNGTGIVALKAAGIEVIENICGKEALEINRGFFSVIEKKRPFIALKIATSLDGKISGSGERWITGEAARSYGQLLRSRYDAILTGTGTILTDDPLLTCRLPGLESRSPLRIVLDRSGRTPENANILKNQQIAPTWLLREKTIPEAINKITEKGITRLLVEAGAKLTTSFLESGMADRVYWFRAPVIIGKAGLDATNLTGLAKFKQIEHIRLRTDNLDIFECLQE
jgi:diaminohydroxyphosphoribosylaminopyrimidine deaminase/5-amino-6-(5-phosphoribosylamino)uracil reductase